MAKPGVSAGGGVPAIIYTLKKAHESGNYWQFYKRMRSKNACKTCAVGMGGQQGGMVNEAGHFPEVCKKSAQAQAGDMNRFISEAFLRETPIAKLEALSSRELEKLGRLTFPIAADEGDTHFRRISWDEALDRAAAGLKEAQPDEVFFYSSGRSSNEAAFLLQLVARAYGTANIHNCSFYCHQASGVALNEVYGSGTSSVTLDDLAHADIALIAGANPASNHPRLITQLMELKRRGGRVIVVNPLKEVGLVRFKVPSSVRSLLFGTEIADLYLQPHAGSDVAVFVGILKALIENGRLDQPYIDTHTAGWPAISAKTAATPWESISESCGLPRDQLEAAAAMLGAARSGIFMWAMGLTHHANGVDNILSLANVALARGWLGKPGSGLLPIRGHSNVQGVGSVGMTPALKEGFAAKLEELYGIAPAPGGQHTAASIEAAAAGQVKAAVLLGGNLFASNPDRAWAGEALRNIPLSVSITTKLNEGHIHGRGKSSIILPVLARDEEPQSTTQESMFNFVRLSEGGKPAVRGSMRSEVDIIAGLAQRVLPEGRFDWAALRNHHELRQAMSRAVPGYAAIAEIDRAGKEFQVGGRTFHEPSFSTADGRARFNEVELPAFAPAPGEFRLMTIRSEGQFNTVVYEEEDLYRGNKRRDVVMMAAEDARRLGLAEGDRVAVETEIGAMNVSVAVIDIRAGNLAMYYPEANAIVPRKLDERSKTPAFKSVIARLRRAD